MNPFETAANVAKIAFPASNRPPEKGSVTDCVILSRRDLDRIGESPERVVQRYAESRFRDFAEHLCRRICNTGPTVVDLKTEVAPCPTGARITFATPLIPARPYGDVVHRQELAMPALYRREEPPPAKPSLWERFKRAAAKFAEPIPYDGPRGWRDA